MGLLAALFALAPACALLPGDDQEERIRALERRVEEQAREIEAQRRTIERLFQTLRLGAPPGEGALEREARAFAAQLGPAPGAWGRPPSGPEVAWGGYFTVQYRDHEGGNSTFDAVRLVPQMSVAMSEDISFSTEIEFERGGAGASFLTDNEILVEYAEIRFDIDEAFAPKAGVLLIPFNRFNLLHDDPLNELNDRPFVARRVIPSAFGQPGFGFDGGVVPSEGLALNYDVAVTNGFDAGFTTNDGSRGARQSFGEDNNNDKEIFARVGVVPEVPGFDTGDFGASFTTGEYDDEGSRRVTGYGFDWFLRRGSFDFLGEWAALALERRSGDGPPALDLNGNGILGDVPGENDAPRGLHGLYAQANVHFLPEAWRGRRPFTPESEFTLALRFDTNDLNDRAVGATPRDDREAWTLGLNFRPIKKTVVKTSYQWIRSPYGGPGKEGNRFVFGISTYF